MSDVATENFKRTLRHVLARWERDAGPALAELGAMRKNSAKADAKRQATLRQQVDRASDHLRLDLMLVHTPPTATKKDLIAIPGWMKKIIDAKGIPIGGGLSIRPDLTLDFKKVGVVVRWSW